MLLTLALVVFFGAIFVFFSQEFIRTFKRIFAIKGAKIFLPLAIASWLVFNFDYWFLWAIYYVREVLRTLLSYITWIIPWQIGPASIALILFLTLISVVPVIVLDFVMRKRTYKTFPYPYLASTLIWIVCSVLLLVI